MLKSADVHEDFDEGVRTNCSGSSEMVVADVVSGTRRRKRRCIMICKCCEFVGPLYKIIETPQEPQR